MGFIINKFCPPNRSDALCPFFCLYPSSMTNCLASLDIILDIPIHLYCTNVHNVKFIIKLYIFCTDIHNDNYVCKYSPPFSCS